MASIRLIELYQSFHEAISQAAEGNGEAASDAETGPSASDKQRGESYDARERICRRFLVMSSIYCGILYHNKESTDQGP